MQEVEAEQDIFPKSNLIKCPECGMEIFSKAKKCVQCGKNLAQKSIQKEKYVCKECGNEIENKKRFVPNVDVL